jgi:type I restriction enzyme S subunit
VDRPQVYSGPKYQWRLPEPRRYRVLYRLPGGAEGLRTRVQKYDLLVTITGANVGKAALVEEDIGDAYVSQHVGLIRLGDKERSGFAFLWLLSGAHGRGELLEAAYGQGKPGLNLNNLRTLEIAFPPAAEQSEILRIVKSLLARAARLEARLATAQRRLHSLRQAVLSRAFRGELVQTERELAELRAYESEHSEIGLEAVDRRTTSAPRPD